MAQARDEWRASRARFNPEHWFSSTRPGAATDMARYGRCPRGQRLVSSVVDLEDHDIRRRAAGRGDRRTLCVQQTDEQLSRLCRAVRGPEYTRERYRRDGRDPSHKVATAKPSKLPAPSCATCPRTAPDPTPSNSSSLNSKPCSKGTTRPSKAPHRSNRRSPHVSPQECETTSQTKAIAANYESALASSLWAGVIPAITLEFMRTSACGSEEVRKTQLIGIF